MATNPKHQANLGKIRAQELMDTNNAAASNKSDQLLSILEAGKGSSIARDLLDQYLHNYIRSTTTNERRLTTIGYEWAELRKLLSIKEKIAYVTGLVYADRGDLLDGIPLSDIRNVRDDRLRNELNKIVTSIETNLMNKKDFTESWILRNAAANRFECKLSTAETNKLNEFSTKVRDICLEKGLDTLVESTHFTHESDAQKILKLSGILIELSAMGVSLDDKLLNAFEPFNEKIKPLRDLDEHYKHVTKTLNMLHRVAEKGYHSMVTPTQKVKLDQVLQKLEMTKTVNEKLNDFSKIENFDKNDEHGFLDDLIVTVKGAPQFNETIASMSMSEAQFNERFMTDCAFTLVNTAKNGLHKQKGKVFGDRLAHFEADTQSWRGMVRNRIFDIADRMGESSELSDEDFVTANSYFEKFRDLFFAKEEDNYQNGVDRNGDLHFHKMEKVLSAIIRRRTGDIIIGDRIRRGSAGRILLKFIENGLKGKDRGMYSRMRRIRHRADDATVIAMVIMAQNQATNQVFYQDRDKTKKADSRRGKLRSKVSFTERGREGIRDRITPTVNKVGTLMEETVIKGLKLSKGIAKVTNKVVSKTARATTRTLGAGLGKYNTMMEKRGYKRWKTPFYLPYLISKPGEEALKLGYKGTTYTDRMGNTHLDELGNVVSQGYEEAKDLVSKGTGEDTDYLFKGITYATEEATSLGGKTISATGKRFHDKYTTGQQRGILGAFYAAAKEQKGIEDLMQSADLADILNLKHRGPRLFDEDGRMVTTEHIEAKDENSPEGIGKEMNKNIANQLSILIKQADVEIQKKIEEEKRLTDSLTDEENEKKERRLRIIGKEIDTKKEQKTIIKDVHDEISKIIPVIKKPVNAGGDRDPAIAITIVEIEKKIDGGIRGSYTKKIKKEIEEPAVGLTKKLEDEEIKKNTAKLEIKTQEGEIRKQEALSKIGTNAEKITAIGLKADAEKTKREKEEEVAECNTKIETLKIEITNKKNLLSWLTKLHNQFKNLDDLIKKGKPKPEDIEQFKNINKNLDLLLYPEEEKKGDKNEEAKKILTGDITDDKKSELLKSLFGV